MPGRGYLFALSEAQVDAYRACATADARERWVAALLVDWDRPHLAEVDKAWPALWRCFAAASVTVPVLAGALGGEAAEAAAGRRLGLLGPGEVAEVAEALARLGEDRLRALFFATLSDTALDDESAELDFLYTWQWFQHVRALHAAAAREGRAVLFSVRDEAGAGAAPAAGWSPAGGPDRLSA